MKIKEVYNLKDKFSLGQKVEVQLGKEKGDINIPKTID